MKCVKNGTCIHLYSHAKNWYLISMILRMPVEKHVLDVTESHLYFGVEDVLQYMVYQTKHRI